MARLFGAGFVYDAFLLGFRIPNLTRDLFAEGALSSAFVPIFTQTLAQKGRKEAAILSTCNRTELYAASRLAGGINEAIDITAHFLADYHNLPYADLRPYLYALPSVP